MEMMDVGLNMFETTFPTRTCNFGQRNVLATFHRFQNPRLGRNWALRLRSAIHRYLELKSNPSTVSATSLRTSSTDHCQEQVDFSPLTSKWRNFHRYGGYERLLFKLPDQMRTAQSIQEGHPSMSGDLCLDRSNKIWGKQSRNRCEKILLLTMKRTSKARRKAR